MRCAAGDVELGASDASLLGPRQWLNDACIAYVFELLAQREGMDRVCLLMEPSITFTAASLQQPEVLRDMLSVRRVRDEPSLAELLLERDVVLFPINDNDNPEQVGGSHWSLLCYRRLRGRGGCFEHYDSCGVHNIEEAKAVARCFESLLEPSSNTPSKRIMPMRSPKQVNGYDCGVYVLAIADLLCREAVAGSVRPPGESSEEICGLTPAQITETRKAWLDTVHAHLREGVGISSVEQA